MTSPLESQQASEHQESKHEANTRELRRAAERIAKASREDLRSALNHFQEVHVEWWCSIPRDELMRPIR